ncbi:hypothetical protein GQ43DRAFT_499576 [Delitschia confertaspora ATCC 74209]|uniref:Zn(2)-C6 fungal-type domain-containing protein n=1 Tax=Delitschia confertaspora ATCC 74209 TaxID=1513339 RepID=A0A9P4JGA7_9PLEO|nr:hypothetical protein GQ43DRAFT_499576 [Delitschia confertaspora ATCC 74209]
MTTPHVEDASPSPEYSGDPDGDENMAEQKVDQGSSDASPQHQTGDAAVKPSSNAKDPLRPRRKKARRACLACQRAHLTCGDERPCQRCIKRGLQDNCMDGVRKKAKYLHDAPNEALMPGVGGNYPHLNGNIPGLPSQMSTAVSLGPQGPFFGQAPPGNYNVYGQPTAPGPLPSSMQDNSALGSFNGQPAPISPPYNQGNQTAMPNLPSAVSQGPPSEMQQFGGPLFDPSDPAFFNLDIANLNFGNHFGALEFGMLGHMSSGVAEAQERDNGLLNPLNRAANEYGHQITSGAFNDAAALTTNTEFPQNGLPNSEWQNPHSRHGSIQMQTPNNTPITATIDNLRHDSLHNAHAYAIGQGPSSLSSASPASTDVNSGYDNDNPMASANFFAHPNPQQMQHPSPTLARQQQVQNRRPATTALQPIHFNALKKRRRDTTYIYEAIKEPYPYVAAFHRLRYLIETRFSKEGLSKMMRFLAGFRPLLMAAAAEQDRNDLIQNEKNLQRQLLTMEDMIAETGTPILICRRSGEVVLMGSEFNQLTGWPRDVLLGKKPNLNVNFGPRRDLSNESVTSSRNSRTPIMAGQEPDPGPHPVSVVELMDENSVIQFFDDYSKLAFGDARGSRTRRVKLLKYRTKEDMAKLEEIGGRLEAQGMNGHGMNGLNGMENMGNGEPGIKMLGERLGMVDCMIGWHIKRDIHDMPALIVISILPVLNF